MQAANDAQAVLDGSHDLSTPFDWQSTAAWSDPDQQFGWFERQRFVDVPTDGYLATKSQHLTRASSGVLAVDHRHHLVRLVAENADGGFPVVKVESALSQDCDSPRG